jgi:hypothetical protein
MLVRHDAAREISFFRERGALSARLFGCRFSRIITVEKSKIGSLRAYEDTRRDTRTFYAPVASAGEKRRDVMRRSSSLRLIP